MQLVFGHVLLGGSAGATSIPRHLAQCRDDGSNYKSWNRADRESKLPLCPPQTIPAAGENDERDHRRSGNVEESFIPGPATGPLSSNHQAAEEPLIKPSCRPRDVQVFDPGRWLEVDSMPSCSELSIELVAVSKGSLEIGPKLQ